MFARIIFLMVCNTPFVFTELFSTPFVEVNSLSSPSNATENSNLNVNSNNSAVLNKVTEESDDLININAIENRRRVEFFPTNSSLEFNDAEEYSGEKDLNGSDKQNAENVLVAGSSLEVGLLNFTFLNDTDLLLNASFSDDDYLDEIRNFIFPKTWTWVLIFFHSVVFVIGLVGNILVCVAVYRNHTMRTVTNYFIVNLAVADFLVILFCLPPTVIWDVTSTWFLGIAMCKIVLYLQVRNVLSISMLIQPTRKEERKERKFFF